MTHRAISLLAVLALVAVAFPRYVQAQTPAQATVTANIAAVEDLALVRDANSVTRGSATNILFNLVDSDDPGVTDGSPFFMYAPYRGETGQNWHLLDIGSNGSSFTLTADVTGTAGSQPLSSILDVFFGGLFADNGDNKGGASGDWELLDTFTRQLNEPFFGIAPLNYRLRIGAVPAGDYTGTVTYTLTTTP